MGQGEEVFHKPVLLKEAIDSLNLKRGGIYVDGTVGGGGHAREILERIGPEGMLIGIDLDQRALDETKRRLEPIGGKKILVKGNFSQIAGIVAGLGLSKVDGILLDLGLSSYQLADATRGFSFMKEGPLDMRFDQQSGQSALEIVNRYPEEKLAEMIKLYGEEPMARRIARKIAEKRRTAPIATTRELAEIINLALPGRTRRIHAATRTFQALRIAVNDELKNLSSVIPAGCGLLNSQGRFSIISFHSLEDRIVKEEFQFLAGRCTCGKVSAWCACAGRKTIEIVTKRPVKPTAEEIAANPRARSARLRTAEKI